jgi:sugar phosphate isomerase/epimerase
MPRHIETSLTRREALALMGAASLGACAFTRGSSPAPISRWGVQLYTLRDVAPRDLEGTLRTLADIGYREVETAGYYNRSAADFRRALDTAGLSAPSCHVQGNMVTQFGAGLPKLLDDAATIGHKWLVSPSLSGVARGADGYRQASDLLAKAGAAARSAGVRVAFHNHDADFRPIPDATGQPGPSGMDIFLQSTPADTVFFELDVYWIVRAGLDPVAFLDRHKGRVKMLHVKDAGPPPQQVMSDVGAGTLDWATILRHAEAGGVEHAFVEHDRPGNSIESVRASYRHLSSLRRQ